MGFFKRLLQKLGISKRKVRILVIGLDNAGKSTMLNQLKPRKEVEVAPTVTMKTEEFVKGNLAFTAVDCSGAGKYRNIWAHYYKDTQAVVFVVDATDRIRMCVAKDELDAMLEHEEFKANDAPILFFANKSDVPGAAEPLECARALDLNRLTERTWFISASSAVTGKGLEEGFNWLADRLNQAPQ
eukprot:TRINITY_DN18936_c0_g1_i1.p1 TRINITY_DN18936_c0_g1~~TRINITY_DN18936_c0_g1_i1.p1  ORF type:complete len:185 (+),score=40.96 TRINITY_DN18936_c0_g1_i1:329-883(+)